MPNKKYHSDEGYRKKAIEKSKERYHSNKELKQVKPPRIVKGSYEIFGFSFGSSGEDSGFSIGYLAESTGRTVDTIRKWISSKIIPDTPFKSGGKRVYTQEMVNAIKVALCEMGFPAKVDKKELKERVLNNWPRRN